MVRLGFFFFPSIFGPFPLESPFLVFSVGVLSTFEECF